MNHKKKVWAQLPPLPKQQLIELVNRYESASLEGIWSSQTFGVPFVPLASAAVVSERLKLGTGIALAFTRSPLETACNIMDLDRISGGRCVLGLGSSAKSLNDAFGVQYGKPLSHLREVVGLVRSLIKDAHSGNLGLIEGEYHQLDLRHFQTLSAPVRSEIPVYLPAVFEKACELAGELGDGLLSHPLWCDKWINSVVGDSISTGLAVSGRQRSELDVNLMIFVAINEDKVQAIADARPTIAYYSQSPQYLRYFDFIGFGSEARAIQAAFAAGDMPAMIAACSDNMVEAIALVGSPDEVLKRLLQRTAIADSYTPAIPHYGLSDEQCSYYNNRLAELFYQ